MNHRDNQNEKSIPIKQSNIHRPCLKHKSNQQIENGETGRLSSGRVSFAHPTVNDGKIPIPSQSQINSNEKNLRSATFAKKAEKLRLAELTYFKDHARDKEPIDE